MIKNDYQKYLNNYLNNEQLKIFKKFGSNIDFDKTLLKNDGKNNSLCFAIKKDTKMHEIKKFILQITCNFKINKNKLKKIFQNIDIYKPSWMHIAKNEFAIYFRKTDWVYFV